ncbi:fimbrial protein [Chitinimonas sp.]|uniref:fimbrial protein n=1 Tax=Chitinimonas sp. TaxID=1934313 RepID=UPI0035B05A22
MSRILPLAALLAAGIASAAPITGTINFSGTIAPPACTVDTTTTANKGLNQTVTLPTVNATSFGAAGSTLGQTPFSLQFTGCTASAGGVNITFGNAASADSTVASTFKSTGTATGVSFELLNASAANIAPNTVQNYPVTTTATATYNFSVRYYATSATVNAGTVIAAVPVTVVFP